MGGASHITCPGQGAYAGVAHVQSRGQAMAPSHALMTIDQDGLWSWELGYQEKLYQGMGGGVKGRKSKGSKDEGGGGGEGGRREGAQTYELSD